MSFKIVSPYGHQRSNFARIAADISEVNYESVYIKYEDLKTPEIKKKNPQGKVYNNKKKLNFIEQLPYLESNEGILFGTNAILRFIARKDPTKELIPQNVFEIAQVDKWLDFVQLDLAPTIFVLTGPIFGHFNYDKDRYKSARDDLNKYFNVIDDHLRSNKLLVGNQITIADISLVGTLEPLFKFILEEDLRSRYKNVTRYFLHVASLPNFIKYFGKVHLCQKEWEGVQNAPWLEIQVQVPKKEKKIVVPTEESKESKPNQNSKPDPAQGGNKKEKTGGGKVKNNKDDVKNQKLENKVPVVEVPVVKDNIINNDVDVEVAQVQKTGKNPLDNLPATTFNFYDFKTLFVNQQNKTEAVNFFWQNYDPAGFSIWYVKYIKYEGEGIKQSHTSNMKDSFFQRLDHFRKYAFAVHGVYGDVGNYEIRGVWVWRGTGIPQEILDLPNYEYHTWDKLDHNNEAHRKLLSEYWTGLTMDESVADGLVARDTGYYK